MEFIGKVKLVGDLKVVANPTTGAEFKFRQIVLTCVENYYSADGLKMVREMEQLFDLTYERAENFSIPLGTLVKVGYLSKVTQGGSNWFERKRIYSLVELNS